MECSYKFFIDAFQSMHLGNMDKVAKASEFE